MPVESEIVDEGIDDEAIEVQRPAKLEAEHHVARGIAGRHERQGAWSRGRGPTCGNCTEDDVDDESTQNKLLILVATDVKTGTYAATCPREEGVSEYARS